MLCQSPALPSGPHRPDLGTTKVGRDKPIPMPTVPLVPPGALVCRHLSVRGSSGCAVGGGSRDLTRCDSSCLGTLTSSVTRCLQTQAQAPSRWLLPPVWGAPGGPCSGAAGEGLGMLLPPGPWGCGSPRVSPWGWMMLSPRGQPCSRAQGVTRMESTGFMRTPVSMGKGGGFWWQQWVGCGTPWMGGSNI